MDTSCRLAVAFVLFFAFYPVPALGQGLTGSLSGSVKDEQGGTLAGATVTVSSPSQIGGDQRAIANDKGQWRFPVLAPACTSWWWSWRRASWPIAKKASASARAPRSIGR